MFENDVKDTELNDSIKDEGDYDHVHSHLNNGADSYEFNGQVQAFRIICQGGVDTHFENYECETSSNCL